MALKQLAIPPTPLISLPDSISICSDQAGRNRRALFVKIATADRSPARRRTRERGGGGGGGSHKSLRRTPNNKGMSRSVRQGLALAAEEDAQRFRRLINLRAAGKRLLAFYSRTPQAPSCPPPHPRSASTSSSLIPPVPYVHSAHVASVHFHFFPPGGPTHSHPQVPTRLEGGNNVSPLLRCI